MSGYNVDYAYPDIPEPMSYQQYLDQQERYKKQDEKHDYIEEDE